MCNAYRETCFSQKKKKKKNVYKLFCLQSFQNKLQLETVSIGCQKGNRTNTWDKHTEGQADRQTDPTKNQFVPDIEI